MEEEEEKKKKKKKKILFDSRMKSENVLIKEIVTQHLLNTQPQTRCLVSPWNTHRIQQEASVTAATRVPVNTEESASQYRIDLLP